MPALNWGTPTDLPTLMRSMAAWIGGTTTVPPLYHPTRIFFSARQDAVWERQEIDQDYLVIGVTGGEYSRPLIRGGGDRAYVQTLNVMFSLRYRCDVDMWPAGKAVLFDASIGLIAKMAKFTARLDGFYPVELDSDGNPTTNCLLAEPCRPAGRWDVLPQSKADRWLIIKFPWEMRFRERVGA